MTSKASATRERLLTAALELFAERGYDETTAALIATRAGVTEMTFFRYFPTKASIVVDDPYDPVIGAAIREQPSELDPISRAARGIRVAWQALPPPAAAAVKERLRIVAHTPALRVSMMGGTAQTEAAIADALVEGGVSGRTATIAAAAALGALNASLLDWSMTDSTDLGAAVEAALDVLEDRRG